MIIFVFVKNDEGKVTEYRGEKYLAGAKVKEIIATRYPNIDMVIEVKLA